MYNVYIYMYVNYKFDVSLRISVLGYYTLGRLQTTNASIRKMDPY